MSSDVPSKVTGGDEGAGEGTGEEKPPGGVPARQTWQSVDKRWFNYDLMPKVSFPLCMVMRRGEGRGERGGEGRGRGGEGEKKGGEGGEGEGRGEEGEKKGGEGGEGRGGGEERR